MEAQQKLQMIAAVGDRRSQGEVVLVTLQQRVDGLSLTHAAAPSIAADESPLTETEKKNTESSNVGIWLLSWVLVGFY